MKNKYNTTLFFLFLSLTFSRAQVQLSASGNYSENFDNLANTGSVNTWTDNSVLPNFFSQRTTASVLYAASTGTSSSGGLYSFGATGSSERALGTIGSNNTSYGGDFAHGLLLQNVSGNTITQLSVSYTLEQWRNDGNITPGTITFWYKISSNTISNLNPGSNTGWTAVPVLNASSPVNNTTVSALNGNLAANRFTVSGIQIPSLTLPSGSFIMLKWSDPDHAGSDHALAIDDVSVSWCTNPSAFYQDDDGDGFGNADSIVFACSVPFGYVADSTDCNDNDSTLFFPQKWFADTDNDGYGNPSSYIFNCGLLNGYVADSTDCNDNDSTIFPGALEILNNGIDEDCNGVDSSSTLFVKNALTETIPFVSPNPGNNFLIVQRNNSEEKLNKIEIIGLDGKIILQKTISENKNEIIIETENFADGIYLIRLFGSETTKEQKWIKQRP